MGLLDVLNTDQGRLGLGLLAAGGARSDGANFGQRMQEGIGSVDQWKAQQQLSQQRQMQIDEAKRQQEDAIAMREMAARFKTPAQPGRPAMPASPEFGIPTALGAVEAKPAGYDFQGYAQALASKNPQAAWTMQQAMQKDEAPLSVAAGTTLLDRKTMKPMFTAPNKDAAPPAAIQEYNFAKGQGYQGTFEQWTTSQKKAGATSVNVNGDNLGLKPKDRFDMEQKLTADYSKATELDRGLVATADDISALFKQGGSLKDQAAIYKFAKALDPAGAVREADYAAIVKTAGGLDYLQGLANKALTGEQLSPKQRLEMERVSRSLASVAQQRIVGHQSRFTKNAKMYNLNPENVFQPQAATDDGWAIVGGK